MITNKHVVRVLGIFSLLFMVACAAGPGQSSTGEYIDDSVITTRVKAAIFNDSTLKASEINVETFKGEVQLSGFINSKEDMNKAVELTRSVKGVESVKNDMRMK
ncbi:BON domain-containing protein [Limnobacter thiooxidans]|uniref:BON domain-containing protein n=1 Tax=Limnobacter thiooxidans TaxID=131080 RepID=A0AA86JF89_9BURK|nr:BON domain-containing protein [Limnobacter sp.]MCZ8015614.1 BON domain-containing protein [Limnobacter sp.]RZS42699.1 BON domain-containing protein [Limnobacter thiooxidans]BET25866.1 BON domain-containing protein [Limnobacter thiooxidans]